MSEPQNEDVRLQQLLDFSKFGFRGTLAVALLGLINVPILAYLLSDSDHATGIMVAYCASLVIGVVAFGYFSLRKMPQIVADLVSGKIGIGDGALTERVKRLELVVDRLIDGADPDA